MDAALTLMVMSDPVANNREVLEAAAILMQMRNGPYPWTKQTATDRTQAAVQCSEPVPINLMKRQVIEERERVQQQFQLQQQQQQLLHQPHRPSVIVQRVPTAAAAIIPVVPAPVAPRSPRYFYDGTGGRGWRLVGRSPTKTTTSPSSRTRSPLRAVLGGERNALHPDVRRRSSQSLPRASSASVSSCTSPKRLRLFDRSPSDATMELGLLKGDAPMAGGRRRDDSRER